MFSYESFVEDSHVTNLSIVIVSRYEIYETYETFTLAVAHLTFPPQNWHAEPCQPSWHTQVPLTQSPLTQLSVSQVVSAVSDDEEEEAAAVTCTTQQISATHSIGHGTAITPHWSRTTSRHCPFRRYFDLYRNKNICTTSAILVGFHVRDNGRRRRTGRDTYGEPFSLTFSMQLAYSLHDYRSRECAVATARLPRCRNHGLRRLPNDPA